MVLGVRPVCLAAAVCISSVLPTCGTLQYVGINTSVCINHLNFHSVIKYLNGRPYYQLSPNNHILSHLHTLRYQTHLPQSQLKPLVHVTYFRPIPLPVMEHSILCSSFLPYKNLQPPLNPFHNIYSWAFLVPQGQHMPLFPHISLEYLF